MAWFGTAVAREYNEGLLIGFRRTEFLPALTLRQGMDWICESWERSEPAKRQWRNYGLGMIAGVALKLETSGR